MAKKPKEEGWKHAVEIYINGDDSSCRKLISFLTERRIFCQTISVKNNKTARRKIAQFPGGLESLPVVVFHEDGEMVLSSSPSNERLISKLKELGI